IEGQRGRITDEGLRISFLDTSRTIFDELIGLLASTGDRAAAFEFSERARARALLEDYETSEAAPPGSAVGPLTTDQIERGTPSDVALVEYRLLENRMVSWVITEAQLTTTVAATSRADLEDLVAATAACFRADKDGTQALRLARRLSDSLIQPIERRLANAQTI